MVQIDESLFGHKPKIYIFLKNRTCNYLHKEINGQSLCCCIVRCLVSQRKSTCRRDVGVLACGCVSKSSTRVYEDCTSKGCSHSSTTYPATCRSWHYCAFCSMVVV